MVFDKCPSCCLWKADGVGVVRQIFLRAGQMAELDKIRTELLNRSAIILQRHARGFVARSKYRRQRQAAITLQVPRLPPSSLLPHFHSLWLSMFCRKLVYLAYLRACFHGSQTCDVENLWMLPYLDELRLKEAVIICQLRFSSKELTMIPCAQAGVRGFLARAEARRLRQLAAATKIQAAARMHVARSSYLRTRAAVLLIQAAYRGHTARTVAADLKCVHSLPRPYDFSCWSSRCAATCMSM